MSEQSQNTLFIRLEADSFCYSLSSPYQNLPFTQSVWKADVSLSLAANLKKFFQTRDDWREFKQVNVLVERVYYVVVPLELFAEEQAASLYYYNLPRRENETILFELIQSLNVAVIYTVDTSAYHLLMQQFPRLKVFVQIAPLLEYFAANSHKGNNRKMYVNLHSDSMDIVCMEHGRLLLANTYICREVSDRMYYLMYVWQQLGLDQENDELALHGNIPDLSVLIASIDKFVRHRRMLNESMDQELQSFWQ